MRSPMWRCRPVGPPTRSDRAVCAASAELAVAYLRWSTPDQSWVAERDSVMGPTEVLTVWPGGLETIKDVERWFALLAANNVPILPSAIDRDGSRLLRFFQGRGDETGFRVYQLMMGTAERLTAVDLPSVAVDVVTKMGLFNLGMNDEFIRRAGRAALMIVWSAQSRTMSRIDEAKMAYELYASYHDAQEGTTAEREAWAQDVLERTDEIRRVMTRSRRGGRRAQVVDVEAMEPRPQPGELILLASGVEGEVHYVDMEECDGPEVYFKFDAAGETVGGHVLLKDLRMAKPGECVSAAVRWIEVKS